MMREASELAGAPLPQSGPRREDGRLPPGAGDDSPSPFDTVPRRVLIAGLVVALWMLAGVVFHLGVEAYLLAGVPLMAGFQRLVRRRPLWNAWIFDTQPPVVDARALLLGVALAALPAWRLAASVWAHATWRDAPLILWYVAATAGGLIAGVALRAQRAEALRRALPTALITALTFAGMFAFAAWMRGPRPLPLSWNPQAIAHAMAQGLVYFDVSFVLEEVAFRGVLDPYILGREQGANSAWASAIVSSALWGLWHLPVALAPGTADLPAIARLVLFHVGLGAMLCFVARLAGTLAPGAAVHGFADAFRNALSS